MLMLSVDCHHFGLFLCLARRLSSSTHISNVHQERFIRLDVRVAINVDIKSKRGIAGGNRLSC